MRNDDVELVLNLRFSKQATTRPRIGKQIVNLIIDDIGFKAYTNRRDSLTRNLQRDFAPVVQQELNRMAGQIGRLGVGMGNPSNPPPGSLSISGKISQAMLGNSGPMTIASVTGKWAVRNKAYMKSKFKKYGTRKWMKNTGALQRSLKVVGNYTRAYGPIAMKFTPAPAPAPSQGTTSSLGQSPGGQARNIMIGRLEINPLRRLRLSDLPGIGEKATYKDGLYDRLGGHIAKKLKGRKGTWRPVIEPFLAYYLRRAIPNAVYRKLEQSL